MNNKLFSLPYLFLSAAFIVCLIVSNLIEIKTIDVGWFTVTAGFIVFPISYIINDCVVEVYGFARARLMIWMGFFAGIFVAAMLQVAIMLPGGEEWGGQEAMQTIFGAVPRIMLASFAAFLSGSLVNAYVMSRMKRADGDHRFSLRAIVSTLWGEGTDSIVFFPIAFGGLVSWPTILSLIVTQSILKTIYEILVLPITIRVVRRLKHLEGGDVTDNNNSYSFWKFNEID